MLLAPPLSRGKNKKEKKRKGRGVVQSSKRDGDRTASGLLSRPDFDLSHLAIGAPFVTAVSTNKVTAGLVPPNSTLVAIPHPNFFLVEESAKGTAIQRIRKGVPVSYSWSPRHVWVRALIFPFKYYLVVPRLTDRYRAIIEDETRVDGGVLARR